MMHKRRPMTDDVIDSSSSSSAKGLLLNRRTGYLMGELKDKDVSGFRVQPLNLGGMADEASDLSYIHPYAELSGCEGLSSDYDKDNAGDRKEGESSLFLGGNFKEAQGMVQEEIFDGFKFKFFGGCTRWEPGQLEQQLKDQVLLPAECSADLLLKIREREGDKRATPLWTEIMELAGGAYADICKDFYA